MKQKFIFFAIAIILAAYSSSCLITSVPGHTNTSEPSQTITPIPPVILEDGIYIVGNSNTYEKISPVDDDSALNIPTLPTTANNIPMFVVKGNGFPIDEVEFYAYYAGIGIDTELISLDSSGKMAAKISQVYENSPASEAGLKMGEIIFGVNGEAFQAITA